MAKAKVKKRKKAAPKRKAKKRKVSKLSEPRVHKFEAGSKEHVSGEIQAEPHSSAKVRVTVDNLFKEMALASSAIFGYTADYNPDDLVIDKGMGVKIYQDMLRDPYIKAGLLFKKISVTRLPQSIIPFSDSPRDVQIASFIEWTMENMKTPLIDVLWDVMDGVDVGYSISEKNYRIVDRGRWNGLIGLDSVKGKDPFVYSFEIDDFGNIVSVYQRFGFRAAGYSPTHGIRGSDGDVRLPPDKFVIYSFMKKYSNPYGTSDLRAAFRAFFIKDFAWKFRAIYMEKFGMPPVVGRFPNGTQEPRRKKFEKVLESIQTETVLTIPEDLIIEVLKIAQAGPTEYERAIADLNKEILIGMLGSFLSAEEGKRTGARAQGQVHFKVASLFTYHLANSVEQTFNRQLIRPLVDFNWNVDGNYPTWRMDIPDSDRLAADMNIDKGLHDMNVPLAPDYFYKKYARPRPANPEMGRRIGMDYTDTFSRVRSRSIPDDPRKISQLKSSYTVLAMAEGVRGHKLTLDDAMVVGYDMAGFERKYREQYGVWLNADKAYKYFVERLVHGHISDDPQ